jgi:SiaC family regulatory phosphoprotein
MKIITISETKKTPGIVIDYGRSTITISGVSIPENAYEFYQPILEEFLNYKAVKSEVLLDVYLEYFNSGSSRFILALFLEAAKYDGKYRKASVNWIIEKGDEELRQSGEVFEQISKLKFTYKEVE